MDLIRPDIKSLSGIELENYVAAIFQHVGYYVNRDLTWTTTREDDQSKSIDVVQIDVLALNFHPFGEDRILVECKGGGTFSDIFKFLGVKTFINPQQCFLVCNNPNLFNEIHKIGRENGINVIKPNHIIDTFSSGNQNDLINFWFSVNTLCDRLIDNSKLRNVLEVDTFSKEQADAYNEIRKLLAVLKNHIWKDLDPREQCNKLETLFFDNKGFVRKILSLQKLSLVDTENAISKNILCESSAYVILLAKIYYIVSAVRCAINSLLSSDDKYLEKINNKVFIKVVKELINNINLASKLPNFIQFWIFLCGGMIDNKNDEIEHFSKLLNISSDDFEKYIDLLKSIFTMLIPTGEIQWSINSRGSIEEFNAVPNSIRGMGIKFRQSLNIDIENFIYKKRFLDRLDQI